MSKGNAISVSKESLQFMPITTLSAMIWSLNYRQHIPMKGRKHKESVLYLHKGVLLKHKKNGALSIRAKWMDLDDTVVSEISQVHANFACGCCLKTWPSL